MADDQVRVRASIHFLQTEEGGQTSALSGGSYRPNHNFFGPDDREMCMGSIELPEGKPVASGDTIQTDITLLVYPEVKSEITEERQWRIQVGGKLVAVGTILKVLDSLG